MTRAFVRFVEDRYDPDLVCDDCQEVLCTIEDEDEFEVLVALVDAHVCGSEPS